MHEANLVFEFSGSIASAIARALSPEANASEVPKTRAHVAVDAGGVRVRIEADDLASMRAAVNSYCRWVDAAARAAGAAT